MENNLIAKVAVYKVNLKFDKLYSYLVPKELKDKIDVGKRVVIPFGIGNKKRQGLIIELEEQEKYEGNIKSICAVLDKVLHVSVEMLDLVKWIKDNYFCTYYEAVKLILPEALKGNLKSVKYSFSSEVLNRNLEDLEKDFFIKVSELKRNYFDEEDLKNLKINNRFKLLDNLLSKGLITEELTVSKISKKRVNKFLVLSEDKNLSEFKLTKKQKEVLQFLSNCSKKITIKNLSDLMGVSASTIKSLIKKGIIYESEQVEAERIYNSSKNEHSSKNIVLSAEQSYVFEELLKLYKKGGYDVSLIHGVTGSGKTQVILKLIDYIIKLNKSVIFLVPEIALTTQFTEVFKSKYEDKVAVVHSKVSDTEKADTWRKAKSGEIKVILGARSAVFAPLNNLGLIVVDEEHEAAYKSESSPKIDAREVAKYRCKYNGCMLIFSSATPSVESYYNALNGKYHLYSLKSRYNYNHLPEVKIVDMSDEIGFKLGIPFSVELVQSLKSTFLKKEQSIILVNRRGYNTFVKCKDCEEVQRCPYCSVSLIYHKVSEKLVCHYCGYSRDFSDNCGICGRGKLIYLGFGTQKIEVQLSEFIPEAKILRMDSDLVNKKIFSREKVLKSFENGEYDILIGTQMVSKGFNFPKVTLVGIIMADQSLFESDFRSYEKAFSLITQTVGRAGRGSVPGKAIIQTFTPENQILNLAADQNYTEFFENEIKLRKLMLNPPFVDICVIMITGKNEEKVWKACTQFFENLKSTAKNKYGDLPLRILPPTAAIIKKISNSYRYKIVIKCRNGKRFRNMIRELIFDFKNSGEILISVDINPTTIL